MFAWTERDLIVWSLLSKAAGTRLKSFQTACRNTETAHPKDLDDFLRFREDFVEVGYFSQKRSFGVPAVFRFQPYKLL